ncbi:Sec14p-like phosphatidylinositol transfer family protein [Zostera marina]|uniref:Sec14p-like phosphatidylinositol transfer family protein n=1 Tax=Zostera marina TaxID=29655 RepID=A0A0K9PJ43_ZOSMR|nr:Sec14p-like phosphatidylinositol transfer family protein [Zostera marina]
MSTRNLESIASKSYSEEQKAKISEIRASLGQLPEKLSLYCSDSSIRRHLIARNWDLKKSRKMLKNTLKWRRWYKPDEISWDDISKEAETGKIYRTDYLDRLGRAVLVMKPSSQNTNSAKGQIKYLVYSMENAILNLPPHQQQMVWIIDFEGFKLSHISINITKETARILQDHYPERLGVAIMYNPPKFFESFWKLSKPFLEPRTVAKVHFVYSNDPNSMQIIHDIFDMEKLEQTFGGKDKAGFNFEQYAERMKSDDRRMSLIWTEATESETPDHTTADQ